MRCRFCRIEICEHLCCTRKLIFNSYEGGNHILTTHNSGLEDPRDICDFIVRSLDADKATDIDIFKIDEHTAMADYMVVATGQSSKQVIRLAEKVIERLAGRGHKGIHTEGLNQGDWVIVDTGEVIIHLFRPEVRSYYNIEKIWSPHAGPLSQMDPNQGAPLGAV